jgi:alpha-amylase
MSLKTLLLPINKLFFCFRLSMMLDSPSSFSERSGSHPMASSEGSLKKDSVCSHRMTGLFLKRACLTFLLLISSLVSFGQSPDSTFWWNDAVFYEVFVRSFKDSNGDGQGDLKGLIGKLDYLNDGDSTTHTDLGVTGIWLMPIQQSPSYHGYDVIDYRTVEQDYGTNADFQNLITEAHKRGIKVIIDYVMNHTSSQHPWFQTSIDSLSAKRNWYVWQNPKPNMTGPWGQQVWYPQNGSNYYAIFWSGMPDLNYRTPEVKTEMFDVARFWLQDMNADGFRLDATRYIIETGTVLEEDPGTFEFWKEFRSAYKSYKADAFAVGEAWAATDISKEYVSDSTLDYCFEFDLAAAIVNAVNSGATAGLRTQVDKVMASYPFLQFGTFLTNHDMNRVMDQFGKSFPKAKVASDLLMTLPGVAYVYYGEEIGMIGSGVDENKRTPLQWDNTSQAGFTTGTPWRPVNADFAGKNIKSQQSDTASLWTNYRNLISIRNNQVALRKGNYKTILASASPVISFLRQYQNENIVVVSNTGASAVSNVQLSLTQGGITPGNYILVELQGDNQLPLTIDNTGGFSNLLLSQIPAQSTLIYKLLDSSKVATTVTFQIDMNSMIASGNFNPATDSVDIVASFNHFGADSITILKDINGNGIYSITISGMNIGSKINYKYRVNATNDARAEVVTRQYTLLEGENTVKDNYQMPSVTGIASSTKHDIAVYPVPSAKELFIDFSFDFTGTINYRISDLLGVERISFSFVSTNKTGQYNLSCEELPEGVYLLTLAFNGMREVFRIVVQK